MSVHRSPVTTRSTASRRHDPPSTSSQPDQFEDLSEEILIPERDANTNSSSVASENPTTSVSTPTPLSLPNADTSCQMPLVSPQSNVNVTCQNSSTCLHANTRSGTIQQDVVISDPASNSTVPPPPTPQLTVINETSQNQPVNPVVGMQPIQQPVAIPQQHQSPLMNMTTLVNQPITIPQPHQSPLMTVPTINQPTSIQQPHQPHSPLMTVSAPPQLSIPQPPNYVTHQIVNPFHHFVNNSALAQQQINPVAAPALIPPQYITYPVTPQYYSPYQYQSAHQLQAQEFSYLNVSPPSINWYQSYLNQQQPQFAYAQNNPYPSQIQTATVPNYSSHSVQSIPNVNQPVPQSSTQTTNAINNPVTPNTSTSSMNISAQQQIIANRPTTVEALPEFDGDAEHWPYFISQYRESTRNYNYSNLQNTKRLHDALKGEAFESVKCFLVNPDNVNHVITTLTFLFGRPELLLNNAFQKINTIERILESNIEGIIPLSVKVQQVICIFETLPNGNQHINNPVLLKEIVDKLPFNKRELWISHSVSLGRNPNLTDLCYWLQHQATILRMVGVEPTTSKTTPSTSSKKSFECFVCKGDHTISKCPTFKSSTISERWNIVKKNSLCSCCLRSNHSTKDCRSKLPCKIDNCTKVHNRFLHDRTKPVAKISQQQAEVLNCQSSCSNLLLKIIPIKIFNGLDRIETFALLDEGSKLSLVDSTLLEELNIDMTDKPEDSLLIKWYGNEIKNEKSKSVTLEISGQHGQVYTLSDIKSIENLDLPSQSINTKELPDTYKEFRDIPLNYSNAKPRILLGLAHSSLGFSENAKEKDGLIASNTKLGWSLHGILKSEQNLKSSSTAMCLYINCDDENIHDIVENYINSENLGIATISESTDEENDRAKRILEETTRKIPNANRFETGLLWKDDNVHLPNNFSVAYKRLILTEKRMAKDPDFAKKYEENLMAYVHKGYARLLSKEEIDMYPDRKWYLPHFVSLNPNKPNKFRIVFDAAAKFQNVSLNTFLLKGPDLNQPLLKLLLNFRKGKYVVCGDIKEMFNQVVIRKEDQHCQRFVWRHGNSKAPLETYIMSAMLFGAACSPCSAQYVKNKNAQEYIETHKDAANAILEYHYVDDFVMSFETKHQAIQITKEVREIHMKGGFLLTKFVSNSNDILQKLEETIPGNEISMNKESNDTEKMLGLYWNRSQDYFMFKSKLTKIPDDILDGARKPTKREVLKIVMSIYDPLGFIHYFTVVCKILLQDIWRDKINWDDKINDDHYKIYKKWQEQLKNVENIKIPRQFFSFNITDSKSTELHIFSDASAKAFCAVAYIRCKKDNEYHVSYVISKIKVAPINKESSIPRLELQAALLGCKLSKIIKENLKITFDKTYFWCDSKVVLYWITSNHMQFKIFVSNRVKFIQENSSNCEWKYISTKINVADYATKMKSQNWIPKTNHVWITGPEFLRKPESEWVCETFSKPLIDKGLLELRAEPLPVNLIQPVENFMKYEKYSSYNKLKRIFAFILRAKNNFLKGRRNHLAIIRTTYLKFHELREAEFFLCKRAQQDMFTEEIDSLTKNGKVQKFSSLKKLCPFIDEYGLLRVCGRLDLAERMSYSKKRPIILPKNHRLTFLILRQYHEHYKHQNKKLAINETRMLFWITNIKSQLNKVIMSCQYCKNLKTSYEPPIMCPLPEERISPLVRPFSYTGVDYCGPYTVKVKRSFEKRWIVIFNCLTTRAVHLEVAHKLTADNCLLCLNNFMNRRGTPVRVRSDNAGYFTSSSKTLKRIFESETIQESMNSKGIQWLFNCPETPHLGGAWERLIQIVKKIISCTLSTCTPGSEVFHSIVIEAEAMVNSRPLVDLSDDIDEDEPITPNHFLMGTSLYQQTPVIDEAELKNLKFKKQFRILNNLKNYIWKRWETEYLPQLIPREKWYTKNDPPKEDDLIIFKSSNSWLKGIIRKVYFSRNGGARYVDIQTGDRKVMKKAIHNIRLFRK